jgi:hypothetical protein
LTKSSSDRRRLPILCVATRVFNTVQSPTRFPACHRGRTCVNGEASARDLAQLDKWPKVSNDFCSELQRATTLLGPTGCASSEFPGFDLDGKVYLVHDNAGTFARPTSRWRTSHLRPSCLQRLINMCCGLYFMYWRPNIEQTASLRAPAQVCARSLEVDPRYSLSAR